jgi:cell fate regulator YaaT (PSP1 superfamily)
MECVGVRFAHGPKIYNFKVSHEPPPVDSWVVVKTRRGLELAKVRTRPRLNHAVGEVVRLATPEDLSNHASLKSRGEEVQWWLKARLRREGVQAKVLGCEFTLDGNHILVHYSADERIDLRRWVNELNKLGGARVEFIALGPRDQTAHLGALGACGMESCCSTWLQDFTQVSIKMARDQQLPLSPEKISGPCGRLLCCLQYEHDHYQELLADLPRKNAKACSIQGTCGKVAKLNPLAGTVDLITDEGSWVTVHKSELKAE